MARRMITLLLAVALVIACVKPCENVNSSSHSVGGTFEVTATVKRCPSGSKLEFVIENTTTKVIRVWPQSLPWIQVSAANIRIVDVSSGAELEPRIDPIQDVWGDLVAFGAGESRRGTIRLSDVYPALSEGPYQRRRISWKLNLVAESRKSFQGQGTVEADI